MDQSVTHRAVIQSIDGHDVTLRIDDAAPAACGGCRLADLCVRADDGGRITVTVDDVAGLHRGDHVVASVDNRSQGVAIVWSVFMPLVIFMGALMPLSASTLPRWAVLVVAVSVVAVYDLLLWLFGPRISRSVKWVLTKEG